MSSSGKPKEEPSQGPMKKEIEQYEIIWFRDELKEKINESVYEVNSFIISPSEIKKIDPSEKLKKAREKRKEAKGKTGKKRRGYIGEALGAYREAFFAALYKRWEFDEISNEYLAFFDEVKKDDVTVKSIFSRDEKIRKLFDLIDSKNKVYKLKLDKKIIDAMIGVYEETPERFLR